MSASGLAPPPAAAGLPLLGNALSMMGDIQGFLVGMYRRYGPVFRIRALHQSFVVLAGPEANRLLAEHGDELFSSEQTMGGLNREFGMRVHVLRGTAHRHLRRTLATAISRDLLAARWTDFTAETERVLDRWQAQPRLAVVDECQRLAAAQFSITLTGAGSATRFDDLRYTFELMLDATLAGKWPPMVLRWPAYRRARARVLDFARERLADRTGRPPCDVPDLIDRALAAVDEQGQPYPYEVRVGMAMQGYFAGINTVAYLYSFMLYALLRHPDVWARVSAEVDRVYEEHGQLRFDDLRRLPALHGLALETLRVYPPAPASSRTVVKPFAFQGHRIDEGRRVLVATTVAHHLAEHYPDPDRFDIDRDFAAGRRAGVYAPFSVGSHTCLGAGMTEVVSVATMALVVRRLRLALPEPGYALKIRATPGPNPGRRFRVTVLPGA